MSDIQVMANGQSVGPPAPPDVRRLRRIGIHGARATGKTCYLTCLYGARASEQGSVVYSDEKSLDYLKMGWGVLRAGEVPGATAQALPEELRFALFADGLGWNVLTRDYAGLLIERNAGIVALKQEVKDWLREAEAILLFINIDVRLDREDRYLKDRQDELDMLLTELKALSHNGNSIGRPLALVLTKWDTLGEITNDPARERQRAWSYLNSRPALKQIADSLKNCGDRVELFPVSAFGGNRERTRPPVGGPQPVGLHAPLVWACNKAEEMLLDGTRRRASALVEGHLWPRYGKAVRLYQELIDRHGVNKGPTHERVLQEMEPLRRQHSRQRTFTGIAAAAVLLVGCLVGWFNLRGEETRAFENLEAFLAEHAGDSQAPLRLAKSEDFLTRYSGLTSRGTHLQKVRQQVDFDRVAHERHQEQEVFAALRAERERLAGDQHAMRRLELLEKYPHRDGPHRTDLARWRGEDREAAARFREEQEYNRCSEQALGLEKDAKYDDVVKLWKGFSRVFPATSRKEEIERRVEEARKGHDTSDYDRLLQFERANPENFEELLNLARTSHNRPGFRFRTEVETLIARTRQRWDRREYEKVRAAVRKATTPSEIESAARMAWNYVREVDPPVKAGKAAVEGYLKWFAALQDEKDYYITVKGLSIPSGSKLDRARQTRVFVKLGSIEHQTHSKNEEWARGLNPQIDRKLGPFRFKWGQESTLSVQVQEHNLIGSPNWAEGDVSDARFILGKAHGTFITTCVKGKQVEVYLECPEAVAPVISEYPE